MQKVHIQSAVQRAGGHSNINLDRKCLATFKIGQILPIMHQECVPSDKFRVHIGNFTRFEPLAVPSFVNLYFRTMSVFVPYHQLADGCESYFANQQYFKGKSNAIPTTNDYQIKLMFIGGGSGLAVSTGASATNYDIADTSSSPTVYYLFTPLGRYIWKTLQCMGYRLPRQYSATSSNVGRPYNMLPLLAYCHAYNSFLSYSPNYNTSTLSGTLETIKRTPNSVVDASQLRSLLADILLTYEDSFFTTAWTYPYSGVNGTQTNFRTTQLNIEDGTMGINSVNFNYNVGANVDMTTGSQSPDGDTLTAAQVRMLLKFDDFFRRSNFAGSKDIEQIYSRFGVKIDDYKTRYPYFLNSTSQEVQIGDVTATSDTVQTQSGSTIGAPIGSYAGKAIGSGDAGFTFESHDYGMLITLAWYAPKPLYYLGMDKECLRTNPYDFYTPEFDEGFASPVLLRQLDGGVANNGTFGYVPLYSEYLMANDQVVGDFDRLAGFEAWHFGRKDLSAWPTAQTGPLVYIPNVGSQFERIFKVSDPTLVDADTIYATFNVDVSAVRPMKDYSGKAGLGDGNIDLQLNGSQMS